MHRRSAGNSQNSLSGIRNSPIFRGSLTSVSQDAWITARIPPHRTSPSHQRSKRLTVKKQTALMSQSVERWAPVAIRVAQPLDVFVTPKEASVLCADITLIFRDHGLRTARNKSRLAFLIADWGVEKFREELERRRHRKQPLLTAGKEARGKKKTDHIPVSSHRNSRGSTTSGLLYPSDGLQRHNSPRSHGSQINTAMATSVSHKGRI